MTRVDRMRRMPRSARREPLLRFTPEVLLSGVYLLSAYHVILEVIASIPEKYELLVLTDTSVGRFDILVRAEEVFRVPSGFDRTESVVIFAVGFGDSVILVSTQEIHVNVLR
jgi:hypothetical protein